MGAYFALHIYRSNLSWLFLRESIFGDLCIEDYRSTRDLAWVDFNCLRSANFAFTLWCQEIPRDRLPAHSGGAMAGFDSVFTDHGDHRNRIRLLVLPN